jgi:hypothetical protein
MGIRDWAIAVLGAAAVAIPATSAQQQTVTRAEAIEHVTQHGSASSFYGPVAKKLCLQN